ncbi:MAG: helix-turn-helix transcriptional regulator [Pirellulaceae bacterium]|jgi:transcriptional regulator with XRE-family HTH domain|nr:helix-turn-helix transcriptional regulator [Pirellulaceae bacterium]
MVNSVHTKRYRTLLQALIEARKAKKLSQADLAEMLGRVQTFVSKYERGERRLDVIEFIEVAEVLDMDIVRIIRKLKATNEE